MSSHYKNITKQPKDFWSAVTAMWQIEEASCESPLPSWMFERPNRLSLLVERGAYLHGWNETLAFHKVLSRAPTLFFVCASVPISSLTEAEDKPGRCQRPLLWFPETWGRGRTGGDLQWQPPGRKWHIGLNLLPVRCELPFMTEGKCCSLPPSLWLHSSSLDWLTVSLSLCGMTQTIDHRFGKSVIFPLQGSVVALRKVSGKGPVLEWISSNTFGPPVVVLNVRISRAKREITLMFHKDLRWAGGGSGWGGGIEMRTVSD